MKIAFLGHACFRIDLDDGRRLIVDPYQPGGLSGRIRLGRLPIAADIVLVTHEHADHTDLSWIGGEPVVVRWSHREPGLTIDARVAAHDELGGNLRGGHVRIFSIRAEGLHLVHTGDLGERLSPPRIAALGDVDVLMVPVGGYFTLGAAGATELVGQLGPRYVLPCHYRSEAVDITQLLPLDPFLRRFGEGSRWPGRVAHMPALDPAQPEPERPTVVVLPALAA